MANELEITGIIKYNKGGVKASLSLSSLIDIGGSNVYEGVQSVDNSPDAIELGSILSSDKPYVIIENLSDTAIVSVQNAASTPVVFCTIPPRAFAGPMKITGNVLNLATDSGTASVRIIAISP